MQPDRSVARALAHQYLERDDPLGWFEALYVVASRDRSVIPWADMVPNPQLVSWLDSRGVPAQGKRALKIGCGLGDDAEELAGRGFDVVAFDISQTAIRWCALRFPQSRVRYVCRNLLRPPPSWEGAFDFVLESYTLQVLPPRLRRDAIARIARFVAPGGTLLVVSRGRDPGDHEGQMPWPLTKSELGCFAQYGLTEVCFDDYLDQEDPPVRRFRVEYRRATEMHP